jgi:hypothetical protein
MSIASIRKITGIGQTTGVFLKKKNVMPREQAQALKHHLQ